MLILEAREGNGKYSQIARLEAEVESRPTFHHFVSLVLRGRDADTIWQEIFEPCSDRQLANRLDAFLRVFHSDLPQRTTAFSVNDNFRLLRILAHANFDIVHDQYGFTNAEIVWPDAPRRWQ